MLLLQKQLAGETRCSPKSRSLIAREPAQGPPQQNQPCQKLSVSAHVHPCSNSATVLLEASLVAAWCCAIRSGTKHPASSPGVPAHTYTWKPEEVSQQERREHSPLPSPRQGVFVISHQGGE